MHEFRLENTDIFFFFKVVKKKKQYQVGEQLLASSVDGKNI